MGLAMTGRKKEKETEHSPSMCHVMTDCGGSQYSYALNQNLRTVKFNFEGLRNEKSAHEDIIYIYIFKVAVTGTPESMQNYLHRPLFVVVVVCLFVCLFSVCETDHSFTVLVTRHFMLEEDLDK